MQRYCQQVDAWLEADPAHVVITHCKAWSLVLSTCHGTGGVIRKAIDETWGSESARNFSQGSARSISRMSFVVLDESKPGLDE
eukprot:2041673-Rhodomonas_salina.7